MKIRKIIAALILPGLLLAGLIGGKLVGKTHSSEVKATDANATLVGVYSATDFNNTEFGGGFNNVLITYTGEAHGLTDDPIKSADVLDKIKINGTTLTESGWGVIPWAGQLWFKIIHPSTVVTGDVLEIESGLTLGNATFENSLHLRLNENSKWEVFVPEVAPNSTYSSIFNDDYNNTQFAGDYNQVLIVYTGVAHGLTADAITTQDVKDKVTINGTPVWGIVPFEGQPWFKIVYPKTVSEGDILEVQDGLTIGNTVMNGFALKLNSSSKWEYYVEPVAPNSVYSNIYGDGYNNTEFTSGYNQVLIVYTGVAHGLSGEAATITDSSVLGMISINDVPLTSLAVIAWEGQYWFRIVYPNTVVAGDVMKVQDGLTVGSAVFQGFTLELNSSLKWVVPVVDYGTFTFADANGDSTVGYMFGINWTENDLPAGWDSTAFAPVDENSGTFVEGVRVGTEIKKVGPYTYYIPVADATTGTIATVKGTWSNGTAKFTVEPFTRQWNGEAWVMPVYDYGTFVFSEANNDSTINGMYGVNLVENDLPAGWDSTAFAPVDESSGTFMNGVRVGTEIKKVTATSYYIVVSGASVGSIVTVKGTWSNGSAKFVVQEFTRQWNGTRWELPLADYDIVSLADANLPDYPNGQINTEDPAGYGYIGDPAYLAKQHGVFGLTNDSQSFAFQFNFETTDTMGNWFDIRIGASGAWTSGHYLRYQFTNIWNDGVLIVGEYVGDDVYNGHTHEVQTDITNGPRLLECGAVKVYGEENLYFVYFKNNGTIAYSTYWELADAPRSNKVGIYAPDTCISMTNSVNPAQHAITLDAVNSTSTALYFNTEAGVLDSVHNWDEYFIPVEDGVKYNFNSVTKDKWNYFKKPYVNQLYLDLGELGISAEKGDILYVGGMFKMAHSNDGVLTAYKLNIAGYYLEFDGNAWGDVSEERYAEILTQAKTDAKAELDAYMNAELYDDTNLAIIEGIVNGAKDSIDSATLIEQVLAIVQNAKEQITGQAKTKQAIVEEAIMNSDALLSEHLEKYDVVTTTDFSAVGDLVFRNEEAGSYSSGAYDDTTTRFIASPENLDGNLIFQFNYESTDPSANLYGSQIYIRMRGNDSDCYRFEIANDMGNGEAGVGISVLNSDVATQRKTYNANFAANTSYKIECGAIDLAGYARTLLFIRINGELAVKEIVDQVADQRAAIRIMDSYTIDEAVTRLSAIEEGTTKKANSSALLGRLILDESSNKANLYATLKGNSLPEDAVLFPMEGGAFTINGAEVNSWRSVTNIRKVGDQKYKVDFDSSSIADGDVVHIGGYFSYLDDETVKSGYRFFDAEFVYHAATDSWTENVPTDRETLIYEAKETLQNYANYLNYSEENQNLIESIVEEYLGKIEAAETEQINSVLAEALALIDAVPTMLDEAKAAAKSELESYRSEDLYRDEEKAELREILAEAYADIDASANQSEIDAVVAQAKAAIDELKTAEQRDAEDLAAKKKAAKADINALAGKLEMDRYSEDNQNVLTNLTYKVLEDIDKATSEAEIDEIVAKYRSDIIAVETEDGSVFNGETYIGGESPETPEKPDEKPSEKDDEDQPTTLWERIVNYAKKALQELKNILKDLFRKISAFLQN